MVNLPDPDPIAERIYSHYESLAQGHRPHLGASEIGEECERKIWYKFRHALPPQFGGRMLRLFETGDREEARIKDNLRAIGIEVYDGDDEYYTFKDFGGHFAGSVDGVACNIPGAEKTPHLLECKTSNLKNFDKLKKDGVQKAKPQHYTQMQVYMGQKSLKRALYVCVCKDTDEIYTERIHFDREHFEQARAKARRIIGAEAPPVRVADDPAFWLCKFCEFSGLCWGDVVPDISCRTCLSSTPNVETGAWDCARWKAPIPSDDAAGCDSHLFLPPLLENAGTPEDAGADWVKYRSKHTGRDFINVVCGPAGDSTYTSSQLQDAHPKSLGDTQVEMARRILLDDDIPF